MDRFVCDGTAGPEGLAVGISSPCTCGGHVHYEDHDVSCPSSLYQAGIERGRKEVGDSIIAWLRTLPRGDYEPWGMVDKVTRLAKGER